MCSREDHYKKLKNLKKTTLYEMSKKIDPYVGYSSNTKKKLIELIMSSPIPIQIPSALNEKPIENDLYTREFIDNLKNQISFWKENSVMWQTKYIESISQNKIHENGLRKTTKNITETEKKFSVKTEVIETGPFSLIPKIENDDDNRPFSQRIKENSILEYVNTVSQKEIEKQGFKTRKDFYLCQIKKMKKESNLVSAISSKKKLKKTSFLDEIKKNKKK